MRKESRELTSDASHRFKQYTKAIDVWSIGCSTFTRTVVARSEMLTSFVQLAVIAEMISGRPLFPGRDCK